MKRFAIALLFCSSLVYAGNRAEVLKSVSKTSADLILDHVLSTDGILVDETDEESKELYEEYKGQTSCEAPKVYKKGIVVKCQGSVNGEVGETCRPTFVPVYCTFNYSLSGQLVRHTCSVPQSCE